MSSWLQASWWQVVMGTAGPSFGYELGCFVLCVLLSFSSWPCLPVALPPRWALLSSTGPASSSSTVSAYQWLFFVDLVLELSPSPVPLPTISWTISWTIPETDPKVTFTSIVLRKVGSVDWRYYDPVSEKLVWHQPDAVAVPTSHVVVRSLPANAECEKMTRFKMEDEWGTGRSCTGTRWRRRKRSRALSY